MQLLLADDHNLFREAFAFYLARNAPELEVKVSGDLHGAIDILADPQNDIGLVLLDYRMPGMNGLAGLEKMRAAYPETPVAILSGLVEAYDVERARQLGAIGYFPKTMPIRTLLAGLRQVLDGEPYFARDHNTDRLMPSHRAETPDAGAQEHEGASGKKLTRREREVLALLAKGESNKSIAQKLGLKIVTVKLHVRGVCRKLGAANRTQAALLAREANP